MLAIGSLTLSLNFTALNKGFEQSTSLRRKCVANLNDLEL